MTCGLCTPNQSTVHHTFIVRPESLSFNFNQSFTNNNFDAAAVMQTAPSPNCECVGEGSKVFVGRGEGRPSKCDHVACLKCRSGAIFDNQLDTALVRFYLPRKITMVATRQVSLTIRIKFRSVQKVVQKHHTTTSLQASLRLLNVTKFCSSGPPRRLESLPIDVRAMTSIKVDRRFRFLRRSEETNHSQLNETSPRLIPLSGRTLSRSTIRV